MIHSNIAPCSMVVTPHHLATESALAVLREGGNAIEAMVAAAATIAVTYPHMNSLGGDGFWIILPNEGNPIAIDASGAAGSLLSIDCYINHDHIPYRGIKSAITVAGTISGWMEALNLSQEIFNNKPITISRLLRDAVYYANTGIPVTNSQTSATQKKFYELQNLNGFSSIFLINGKIPHPGTRLIQHDLAKTFTQLINEGLDSFYRGNLAEKLIKNMAKIGIPLVLEDLQEHQALRCEPLHLIHSRGDIWNMTAPTQGIVSLVILAILDQFDMSNINEITTIHRIVEATKQAFHIRDKCIIDKTFFKKQKLNLLLNKKIFQLISKKINNDYSATLSNNIYQHGDTVWMGIIDKYGTAVSFIQSIYHEFGSGVVIPDTGIIWHNRGSSFNLQPNHLLSLAPRKKPLHTLNPALARLHDGRIMVYGCMGGDGQPQTQASIFNNYIVNNMNLQQAISYPRWLFGRHWGKKSDTLKLEKNFHDQTIQNLSKLGHIIEIIPNFSELVGHAGAIVKHVNGMIEGAFDPRSNGSASGF